MYKVLLDSSNTSLTVGLMNEDCLISSISYECWQGQSEHMIPELDKLLNQFNVDKKDIDGVIVSIGPGSYTGIRIALTIAKVIGVSLQIPVYPVSSLRVLMNQSKPSICVINARSNRSYVGIYDKDKTLLNDIILSNDELMKIINENPNYVLCGDTKYLNVKGENNDIALNMFYLSQFLKPIDNVLGLKPVYLKDNYD